MKKLAVVLAIVAGGLTAVPGTAMAWEGWVGEANNGRVTEDEAVYITTWWMDNLNYHGGLLRYNVLRADPYEDGAGSPFRDVELGVRTRDGSLVRSWTEAPYLGCAPWCFYYKLELNP